MAAKEKQGLLTRLGVYSRRRAKELKQFAAADLQLDSVEAECFGAKASFKVNVERAAAWRLYVELCTRITTQELKDGEGVLRETLNSLHDLFGVTRTILKEAGPGVAQGNESLGFYAMAILNEVVRPFLVKWHPLLGEWEAQRDPSCSQGEHERKWERNAEIRRELRALQVSLGKYCTALGNMSGVSLEGIS